MLESVTIVRREVRGRENVPGRAQLQAWMAELTSPNIRGRVRAREELVRMGEPAVAPLLQAMNSGGEQLRREAARALCEIPSTALIPIWLDLLEDADCDFRWFATKGLIAAGRAASVPLLRALEHRSDSVLFRDGARRVLYTLAHGDLRAILTPVIRALEDVEPALEVIIASYEALDELYRRAANVQNS